MSTFLLVDDSAEKFQIEKLMLKHAGWGGKILIAETVADAKTMIDAHDISYAFVDYYLPDGHGPAVIKYLQQKRPAAKSALVTSADNAKNFAEAKASGADTCICTTLQSDEVEKAFMDILSDWLS